MRNLVLGVGLVSLVCDLLNMAAPFVLPGKVPLLDLCEKGLGWDDKMT